MTLLTITTNTIIITHTWKVNIKQKAAQTEAQQNYYLASTPISMDEMNILDKIIQETFDRYQIFNLAHLKNPYIGDDLQQKIIKEVFTDVYGSVSDNIINKLSLIYKKEHIEDIIVQKIQLIVLNYTIEINGNYKE